MEVKTNMEDAQMKRVEVQTGKNTRQNRQTTYEREHVVQVSAYVFSQPSPDSALESVKDYFAPDQKLAFWLLPKSESMCDASRISSSNASGLSKSDSDSSMSLDGSESNCSNRVVRISMQATFID